MNRPYYALAALVAMLGGSAVAVGPARCQSTTATAAISSRSLCGAKACELAVAADLLVHFETGWEAGGLENISGREQGSDDYGTCDYNESCGYDPCRGERYDAAPDPEDTSSDPADEPDVFGTFAEEYETWPSDERIDAGYREFAESNMLPVCGGDEVRCPYFSSREGERSSDDLGNGFAESENDDDASDETCQQAHEAWLAEQEANVLAAAGDFNDESVFFTEPQSEAWKTAPVAIPDWISEYLSACMPSLEEQYAEAELQAARDAASSVDASQYGPGLPAEENAEYGDEYGSLYGLDAYLIPDREAQAADEDREQAQADNGPVAWSLNRIFGKVFTMFEEILPIVEEQAEELSEAADEALQQWDDFSSRLAMPRDDADFEVPYAERIDDSIISSDEQIVDVPPALPVEAAQSRELLESLAGSLRAAGQLLFLVADELEAEASRVLSAQHEEVWSR